jgi:hypothetical protein
MSSFTSSSLAKSPEAILKTHSPIGSLARVYGVITFILEHPDKVEVYLKYQEWPWEELKAQHPISPENAATLRPRELVRKSVEDSFV